MYDMYLRATTNRLQDDMRYTMRTYNQEKERLTQHLKGLSSVEHGLDRSPTATSMESSIGDQSSHGHSQVSRFFRAPNLAAGSGSSAGSFLTRSGSSGSREKSLPPTDKKWKERRDADKIKKEKEMLKLPVIHSARSNRSEWESGVFLSSPKSDKQSGVDPLPGIMAAKALLSESMKIPTAYDPDRSDMVYDTTKTRALKKKVTFAADDDDDDYKPEPKSSESQSRPPKNSKKDKKLVVPKLNLNPNQFSHVARPVRPKKTSLLPPLELSPVECYNNPQRVTEGVNEWKSLYGKIVDPEERTRALTDILHAVRLKKFENEQSMKYGGSPRPVDKETMMKEYLNKTTTDKIMYRDENGQKRRGYLPTPRNTAIRIGRRSQSCQLHNYLRQMSRSRRMIEHLQVEEYRLAHISGHKALQDAYRQSSTPGTVSARA